MSDPAIDTIMDGLNAVVASTLEEGLKDAAADWKELVSEPYPPASAPGNAPHRRSGDLQASIHYAVQNILKDVIDGYVASDVFYDVYLRDGTPRMAPRPNSGPIETKWERIIETRLALATRQLPR